MAMILYGPMYSPFLARVALAAHFKGMKCTVTPPPFDLKSPAYLKIHPFGKVPALKDGATVVYESAVIVEYLEAKGKTRKLVPKSAKAAAAARQIAAIAAEYVHGAISAFYPFLRAPKEKATGVEAAVNEVNHALEVLEKAMSNSKYAAGDTSSIADVYVIPSLWFATTITDYLGLADPVGRQPKLKKYMAAMKKDKIAGEILQHMDADAMWKSFNGE